MLTPRHGQRPGSTAGRSGSATDDRSQRGAALERPASPVASVAGWLPETQAVAVRVGERELTHSPWPVLQRRDGQWHVAETLVPFVDIFHDQVAAGSIGCRADRFVDPVEVKHAL